MFWIFASRIFVYTSESQINYGPNSITKNVIELGRGPKSISKNVIELRRCLKSITIAIGDVKLSAPV